MKKTPIIPELDFQIKVVSWSLVYGSLFDLAKLIKTSNFTHDIIVGISRGGLVPARILSDLLENPNLETITTKFYVGVNQTKKEPTITKELTGSIDGKNVLVVDDLVDSGESLKLVISHLKNKGASEVKTAVLYRKPWSIVTPDFFVHKTSDWIVFPWDHKENVKTLFEKLQGLGNPVETIKEKLINIGLNKKLVKQISEEKP